MTTEDMVLRESLSRCVRDALEEVNATREVSIPTDDVADLYLYGQHGVFDSLQLVNFMIIFEEKIAERVGAAVSILSANAFSGRVSPFRKVSTLLDYVSEELARAPAAQPC